MSRVCRKYATDGRLPIFMDLLLLSRILIFNIVCSLLDNVQYFYSIQYGFLKCTCFYVKLAVKMICNL